MDEIERQQMIIDIKWEEKLEKQADRLYGKIQMTPLPKSTIFKEKTVDTSLRYRMETQQKQIWKPQK